MTTKQRKYTDLKKRMMDDLERRGLNNEIYTDKIEEYLTLWEILYTFRDNPANAADPEAIRIMLSLSRQLLSIWDALGFKENAKKAQAVNVDNDEL